MSESVWETITNLFDIEGFDYALRYKGMPYTGDDYFEMMVKDYQELAAEIENYVADRS